MAVPQPHKTKHEIVTALTAGAIAGAVAKTTIAPLDRTKINFQVDPKRRYSVKTALRFIQNTVKTEGFLQLWRGNSATLARVVPFAAINFTAHEQWRKVLKVDVANTRTSGRRFLAGSLAGVTSTCCTFPLDMARARLAVTQKTEYRSLISVFIKIWRKEGFFALYRGLVPTITGVIPYAGASFFTFESLKLAHRDSGNVISPFERFVFGAMAGLIGQSSSYPLDIVRRRLQTGHGLPSDPSQRTIIGVLLHVWRTEGVLHGLYKGLSMNWIKGPIAAGISFTTFDTVVRYLRLLPYFRPDADT